VWSASGTNTVVLIRKKGCQEVEAMKLLREFKEFAMRGNVVDLAVGVIIGAAFGGIVNSMVKDVLMPPIGMLTGGVDFADKVVILQEAVMEGDKVVTPAVEVRYGAFINTIINFIIVAACIFAVIKVMNTMKRTTPPPPEVPPPPSRQEVLLAEIRDALRSR
jgi:large conductance mechanosensitive channel